MVHFSKAIAAATLALVLAASEASAGICAPRDVIVSVLEERFQEEVIGLGVTSSSKGLVEVYVGPKGTWSVVVTDPKKRSCILLEGDGWQSGDMPLKGAKNARYQ